MASEAQLLDTFAAGVWTFVVVAVEENGCAVGCSMFCDVLACIGCKMHTQIAKKVDKLCSVQW